MIVKPKMRGFICTTAHPEGCKQNVLEQIEYVKNKGSIKGPKNVLIIGSSAGYGLASRIVSTFGAGANTIGVFFERPAADNRTGTAGWYNTAAVEEQASRLGLYSKSINGDAFSNEIKQQTIETIQKDLGKIDLLIYSLASPRRTDPKTGETYTSVIKPIGDIFSNKTIDFHSGQVTEVTIEPASETEIEHTIKVMGGEDWQLWIEALREADVLEDGFKTVAYSYIGPELTHAVYKNGTIGKAKEDLERAANNISDMLASIHGKAFVSVNKALVTQASSAIPVVPLYISILYKVMKAQGTHEGCIEQIDRLFRERLYTTQTPLDETGRIRIDDLEMKIDVQEQVTQIWNQITTENVRDVSDVEGYKHEFFKLFGFNFEAIDYEKEVDVNVEIKGL